MLRLRQTLESTPAAFVAVIFVALAVQAVGQFADVDLWGRLASAALWTKSGHFPYHDPLSFTAPNAAWFDHEWLSGLIFFRVLRVFGETGLILGKDLVLAATVAVIFWLHRRIYQVPSAYALIGSLATIPVTALGYRSSVRCQIFSFFFFVFFLAWLESNRLGLRRPRSLAWLVPLGILWANLHAGFVLGLFLLLLYGAAAAVQNRSARAAIPHLAAMGGIVCGTALLNPYGPRYLLFLFRAWTMDRSDIIEWAPVWAVQSGQGQIWLLISAAACSIGLGFAARRRAGDFAAHLGPAAAITFLIVLAIRAFRFQTFLAFGLVSLLPAFLPPALITGFLRPSLGRRLKHALVSGSGVFGFSMLAAPQSHFWTAPLRSNIFPVEAIRYLRATHAAGNLVTPFGSGEFAAWSLYPRLRVAIDGRFEEVYRLEDARVWFRYFRIPTASASGALGRWPLTRGAEWIITDGNMKGVEKSLEASGAWKIVQHTDEFTLWRGGKDFSPERVPANSSVATIADFVLPEDVERFGR